MRSAWNASPSFQSGGLIGRTARATPIPDDRFFTALARDRQNVERDVSLILMRGPGQVFRGRYPNDERLHSLCREYLRALPEGMGCLSRS